MAAKKKKLKVVTKAYMTGSPIDSETLRAALGIFGMTVGMMVVFLILGAMLNFDNAVVDTILAILL